MSQKFDEGLLRKIFFTCVGLLKTVKMPSDLEEHRERVLSKTCGQLSRLSDLLSGGASNLSLEGILTRLSSSIIAALVIQL